VAIENIREKRTEIKVNAALMMLLTEWENP